MTASSQLVKQAAILGEAAVVRINTCTETTRIRTNKDSLWDAPEGFFRCSNPACADFIPIANVDSDGWVNCTTCDSLQSPMEEQRRLEEQLRNSTYTHCGLSRTEQGRIVEQAVYDHEDLGGFGRIPRIEGDDVRAMPYNRPLDFVTDLGIAIEVKSVNALAGNKAFIIEKKAKARKDAELARLGLEKMVGLLGEVDYRTSEIALHARDITTIQYFEMSDDPPLAVISFVNPFAATASSDDIPF